MTQDCSLYVCLEQTNATTTNPADFMLLMRRNSQSARSLLLFETRGIRHAKDWIGCRQELLYTSGEIGFNIALSTQTSQDAERLLQDVAARRPKN